MSTCPYCGAELAPDAVVCSACGYTRLGADTSSGAQGQNVHPPEPGRVVMPSSYHPTPTPISFGEPTPRRRVSGPVIAALCLIVAALVGVLVLAVGGATSSGGSAPIEPSADETTVTLDDDEDFDSGADVDQQNAEGEAQEQEAAESEPVDPYAEQQGEYLADGYTLWEGTLRIIGGEELSAITGVPITANGEPCATTWREGSYAILQFDSPTVISDVHQDDHTIEGTYSYLLLGRRETRYGTTRDTLSPWSEYEGQRIMVAAKTLWVSSGVDLSTAPTSEDFVLMGTY